MIELDYGVKLVARDEWGARQPTSITGINPSFGSTRHWEGPHMGDFPHESCAAKVRGIQAFHMDGRGWTDIAYTGIGCPHGFLFEGRGLWRRTAANGTNVGNNTAYAFCYLGGIDDPFTEDGKRAIKAGMNWAARSGGAGPGRNDHNDWKATQCPGVVIETWGDTGEVIAWPPPPPPVFEEDDMPAVSIGRDPRDGSTWEVVNFQTRRWLYNQRQIDSCLAYWASKGVTVDSSGNWSPEDLDDKGIVPGTPVPPDVIPAQTPATRADTIAPVDTEALAAAIVAALPPLNVPGAFEVSFTGAATATPTAPADQPAG